MTMLAWLVLLSLLALLGASTMGLHTTAAQQGHGTNLQYCLTQAGTYATIGLRTSIDGPKPTKEKIDATHHDSTVVDYRPAAIPDLGELALNVWWDPGDATHQLIDSWVTGATPTVWFHLVFVDAKGTTAEFQGFVSGFEKGGMEPNTGLLTGAVTIVLKSVPTYTYANPTA